MKLSEYDEKHVRVKVIYGDTFTGVADYCSYEYLRDEYGGKEDGIIVNEYIIYRSEIASIEEIEVHGTAELRTERLKLRRYREEDADQLYRYFGSDPDMYRYSGWNPYATLEMARKTVQRMIDSYEDERSYSWIMDFEDVVFGTIGAYDFRDDHIEVGFCVDRACWGRGYATEALKKVLEYLTENEGIPCVTAWCASENTASKRVLEKSGMSLVRTDRDGLSVDNKVYDKLVYEYRKAL